MFSEFLSRLSLYESKLGWISISKTILPDAKLPAIPLLLKLSSITWGISETPTDILDCQIGLAKAISGSPLVVGNKVTLLRAGMRDEEKH